MLLDGLCSPKGQVIESVSKIPTRETIQEVATTATAPARLICWLERLAGLSVVMNGAGFHPGLAFRSCFELFRKGDG